MTCLSSCCRWTRNLSVILNLKKVSRIAIHDQSTLNFSAPFLCTLNYLYWMAYVLFLWLYMWRKCTSLLLEILDLIQNWLSKTKIHNILLPGLNLTVAMEVSVKSLLRRQCVVEVQVKWISSKLKAIISSKLKAITSFAGEFTFPYFYLFLV